MPPAGTKKDADPQDLTWVYYTRIFLKAQVYRIAVFDERDNNYKEKSDNLYYTFLWQNCATLIIVLQ